MDVNDDPELNVNTVNRLIIHESAYGCSKSSSLISSVNFRNQNKLGRNNQHMAFSQQAGHDGELSVIFRRVGTNMLIDICGKTRMLDVEMPEFTVFHCCGT